MRKNRYVQPALAVLLVAAIAASVSTSCATSTPSAPSATVSTSRTPCESLSENDSDEFTISQATEIAGGTRTFDDPYSPASIDELPALCDVRAIRSDPGGKTVTETIWMPNENWNGRFQGVGGSGYSCGPKYEALAAAVKNGYAAATTDCGHSGGPGDASFLLSSNDIVDETLLHNWAYDAIHWMTRDAQTIAEAFYGRSPGFSYFLGCSTGGRQALSEAQRFPDDYDGIVAGAPAINWAKFVPSEMWAQLVMKETNNPLPMCKQDAFERAVVAACDNLDGVNDSVIGDVQQCSWDPHELVGAKTECGTITDLDAAVMKMIWDGPTGPNGDQLWFGPLRGTHTAGVTIPQLNGPTGISMTVESNGALVGLPFPITNSWFENALIKHEGWDWRTLTRDQYY